ncbi:MAG: class I SAM-dependent rRNA methyltransferase [Proteobacteria bacterium]|nr:class I SAM-dependent rRNA methyltransferase [Pseudomonadota bacterium]
MGVSVSATITVKRDREGSLERFHPWLFSGAIEKIEGAVQPGDLVLVRSATGGTLGYGHYGAGSIAVKMLTFAEELPGREFFRDRLQAAIGLRKTLGLLESKTTTAFRLVHGEGDGLPGLIVDLIGRSAVCEFHSVGMYAQRAMMTELLCELLGARLGAVRFRMDENVVTSAGGAASPVEGLVWTDGGAASEQFEVLEQGQRFIVDVAAGQKTGFFTDQRENRAIVARYVAGKAVLDCFCYSGGFASYAASAGAARITYVDSSKAALDLARRNIDLNGAGERSAGICADALKYLKDAPSDFDLIVIDPPAFVKHRGALTGGCKGYETINYHACAKVKPGGLVATFSCSQLVDTELFRRVAFKAAAKTGRRVRVLAQFRQAPCHPVSLYHPEGEYLKGLLLEVE